MTAKAASAKPLQLSIALTPRDPAALTRYADAVSDPASPDYHQYLSTQQFSARFGASNSTLQKVRSTLQSQGLGHTTVSANHLALMVKAPTGTVERVLHTQLAQVRLANRRAAVVNLQAPQLPASIAPNVQAVVGLSGLQARHTDMVQSHNDSASSRTPNSKSASVPCAALRAKAPAEGAYTADQIAGAYSLSGLYAQGDLGAGVNIGVYELEPNSTADIAAYQACYGTSAQVSYDRVDGGSGTGSGSGESAFDIEQVIGLAPAAKVTVYQGPNAKSDAPGSGPYDVFAQMISQDKVNVIANSWGECEALEGGADAHAEATLFQEAAIQGQTVLSAAGDNGSEDCDGVPHENSNAVAVDDPGSDPWVTDVGGTSMSALGPAPTESVWNSGGGQSIDAGVTNGYGAGGGGQSTFWPMPAYQSTAPASLHVIGPYSNGAACANKAGYCREVPDVTASSDPHHGYMIYYNGDHSQAGASGWQSTGGTSGGAPLWAAVFALADASKDCGGSSIGFANPALYRAAAAGSYFNDVTSGNNDYTGTNNGSYPAGPGFDMASGLGSPNATALAGELCAQSLRLSAVGNQTSYTGGAVKKQLRASVPVGTRATYSASGLPAGLSINPGTGLISGKPKRIGNYTVTVKVSTSADDIRGSTFKWRIAAPPRISELSLRDVARADPAMGLHLSSGTNEPALKSAVLTLPAGFSVARRNRILVETTTHKKLAHSYSAAGRRVGITLTKPTTRFIVILEPGSLKATPAMARAAAARRLKATLAAQLRDTGGVPPTVRAAVRPSS
ncbi:MAG: putative Ig domain-containing protein [Solirubrobacterales bacterium]|nr:putative Ig domain-containing protein [Solirubrobacterales bacterium]